MPTRLNRVSVAMGSGAVPSTESPWRRQLGRQSKVHGPLGVQPGGVKDWDRCVRGTDQQVDLGAAEQDALGPRSTRSPITRR